MEQKLCLRQNQISHVQFPPNLGPTLRDLDLYDNLISHIKGLQDLIHLTSLDLSFNKIKHIKEVDHLKELKDIYLLQNKISKIEGLNGLVKLRNLELAANRIRVGPISQGSWADVDLRSGYRKFGDIDGARRALVGEEQNYRVEGIVIYDAPGVPDADWIRTSHTCKT